MKIHFTKMHGLGNDFIVVDCRRLKLDNLPEVSRQLCNRHLGIGADQILLLYDSDLADFKMRIFNADGSEVEVCGNGIRCFAKYVWDKKLSNKKILNIETLAGIIKPEKSDGDMIKVDMGQPIFDPRRIPVNIDRQPPIIDYPLKVGGAEFKITCLSMGNPHAVIFVDDLSNFPVSQIGPLIENHSLFPKKINVEFVKVLNNKEINMRVWERGAGETMACGTGASAAAIAANIKGLTLKCIVVHLLGGDLLIEWAEDNHVYMRGPAVEVFEGVIEL